MHADLFQVEVSADQNQNGHDAPTVLASGIIASFAIALVEGFNAAERASPAGFIARAVPMGAPAERLPIVRRAGK